jgi:hypothetical protein
MLAVKHALQLNRIHFLGQPRKGCLDLLPGLRVIFLHRHLKKQLGLFDMLEMTLPVHDNVLQLAKLPLHLFGIGLIAPELRLQRIRLQPFNV